MFHFLASLLQYNNNYTLTRRGDTYHCKKTDLILLHKIELVRVIFITVIIINLRTFNYHS